MATLLINPTASIETANGRFKGLLTAMPPIGLALLAARLRQRDRQVAVYDAFIGRGGPEGAARAARQQRPDVIGLPVVTPCATEVFQQARAIRAASPDSVIVMGNIHADLFAEDILREGLADIVVHGEAEDTIVDIDRAVVDKTDYAQIRGISFRRGEQIVRTAERPQIEDLDSLPFPAWDLFPMQHYGLFKFAQVASPATLICGSRGCPYRCTFCSLHVMGPRRRKRSVRNIVDEIEWLHESLGMKQVAFVDPIFPISRAEGLAFADELISRGLHRKVSWVTETRVDLLDEEMLRRCYESGLRRVMFGIEVGDDEVLLSLKKKFVVNESRDAIALCRKVGVQTVGFFMVGVPGDTPASIERTIDLAREVAPDFAKFTVFVPYPGTQDYTTLKAAGKLQGAEQWSRYTSYPTRDNPPVYLPEGMTVDDVIRMHRRAFRRVYARPSTVWRHLVKIRTLSPMDALRGFWALYAT
ncbi:MAG: radical SAM protein [Deltaproteobacteria bacterium]|nr:radical SAM protein [Deltaproteobacteria bacterium]